MRTAMVVTGVVLALAAAPARAQRRGEGSHGGWPDTEPSTRSAGPAEESAYAPTGDLPLSPRHGMMGAPGAAPDAYGPSRLGAHGEGLVAPSPGVARSPSGPEEVTGGWRAGDRVRSASSADVRAARQQQAPDLEWASSRAPAQPGVEPQAAAGAEAREGQALPPR